MMNKHTQRLAWALSMGWMFFLPAQAQAVDPTQACRVPGHPNELRCGKVQRLLNPADPKSVKIDIHYVVVPAKSRSKLPDPVVMFAGGPGQSAIRLAPMAIGMFSGLNTRRDLVLIDQRGVGQSAPLECEDDEKLPSREAMDSQLMLKRLDACRERLQKLPHGDLRFYGTHLAMQDFDAVREQLGAAQWNVIGGSYGTRAGLEYLRQFPTKVRRMVIDGVYPPDSLLPESTGPDGNAALEQVLAQCEQDAACNKRFPQLRQRFATMLDSLPREVSVRHPVTGEQESLRLERSGLLQPLRWALYVPSMASVLPAAMDAAVRGRFEPLAASAMVFGRGPSSLAMGMHFSVVCTEDVPRMSEQSRQHRSKRLDFGGVYEEVYTQVCRQWPRGEIPTGFDKIVPADSPLLVLSGGADPVTPPRHGERVTQALGKKALHLVAPNLGHGVMSQPCLRESLQRFFNAETDALALDTEHLKAQCLAKIPRPLPFQPVQPSGTTPTGSQP
jgi:pimeloyl-ACP methyl ester carboxylesterase